MEFVGCNINSCHSHRTMESPSVIVYQLVGVLYTELYNCCYAPELYIYCMDPAIVNSEVISHHLRSLLDTHLQIGTQLGQGARFPPG